MTLETILNLVWLGVTVAGVWLWRFRWSRSRRKPSDRLWLEAVAMICILALLFPAISLTDDLHPEVIPVDSVSSKRTLCLLAAHAARASNARTPAHHPSVFACLSDAPANVELRGEGGPPQPPLLNPLSRSTASLGRGPPSLV
jgi:hypothetical protein